MRNFVEIVSEQAERIGLMEECLGKGLMMPNNNANSGSRKIMHSSQIEHVSPLCNPEIPLVNTGFENRFGEKSSSLIKANEDYEVLYKIPKYSFNPNHHYFLVIKNLKTGEYDVLERVTYNYITECYGYLVNNTNMDKCGSGTVIKKDTTIQKSLAFDEYNNRMDGINLRVAYVSCEYTKEDSIIISESAAKKLACPVIRKVTVMINENDIPLNLYGEHDKDFYKSFPDIGQEVNGGILAAFRKEKNDESLFSLSYDRMKDIMMSDEKILVKGKIHDINVYCNNPEALGNSNYSSQIKYYYDEHMKFIANFVAAVGNIINQKCSYNLQKMYYDCKKILEGGQYIKDRPFSNVILEFIVIEEAPVAKGDKLTNRHGGKGCVSLVLPDDQMYLLDNGEYVDMVYNSSTCINRENPGQLIENTSTFTSGRIVDFINTNLLDPSDSIKLYQEYLSLVSPQQAQSIEKYVDSMSIDEYAYFVESIQTNGIILSLLPITESLSIDDLNRIYQHFQFIKPYKVMTALKDSNGNPRYIRTRRDLYCGKQYIYRLKQYAEEKFSATSLSSTNLKNENSKNQEKKNYKTAHARTPIRFGEMETGDLLHLGAEMAIINLMITSVSPHGRRLTEDLLTGDPFKIDIKLNDSAKNRGVEILNAYLLTMGLRIVFKKVPKNIKQAVLRKAVSFLGNPDTKYDNGRPLEKPVWFASKGEHVDVDYLTDGRCIPAQNLVKFNPVEFMR